VHVAIVQMIQHGSDITRMRAKLLLTGWSNKMYATSELSLNCIENPSTG